MISVFLVLAVLAATVKSNDFRVAPGFGSRGDGHVRVTFVTSTPTSNAFDSAFQYNGAFLYRWTNLAVHTGLFAVIAGGTSEIRVPDATPFNVSMPKPGQGIRGIMTADICFQSSIANCETGDHDEIFAHLPALLNSIMADRTSVFWATIGDNFYDGTGSTTQQFWAALSTTTKSKLYLTAPGNYDFWSSGDPATLSVKDDQFGNAFMQYNGMDNLAAAQNPSGAPWNFSVDPDSVNARQPSSRDSSATSVPNQKYLSAVQNFESYTQVGNVGFILFSGAHHKDDTEPFLRSACQWMSGRSDTIDWIVLMGHWATSDHGASDKTTTPAVYSDLVTSYGCDIAKTVFFEGHKHCNMIVEPNVGFLVGGFGKSNSHCSQFGIPYFDSTGGRLVVVYFPISEKMVPSDGDTEEDRRVILRGATERYAALQACVDAGPLANCMHLEHQVWMNVSSR